MNQVKLLIPSHSEPLQWEKIGKVANQVKLATPSHSEPLWWEKIGKVANWAKLAVPSHSEPLRWYHLVVWSQFAFGSLPHPTTIKLPRFDQNFLDTGLGFASQRIFLRKTNNWVTGLFYSS